MWLENVPRRALCALMRIDEKSLWRLLRKVSAYLVPRFYSSLSQIGGEDVVVEVDESKFGRRKNNRGHRVDGVWIVGVTERTSRRRIIMSRVADRSKPTLHSFIRKYVKPESHIYSDKWKGYLGIEEYFRSHQTVNHSLWFKDPETGVCTNTIEGNWDAVKKQCPVRCRTASLVDLYLVRFMLRREHGKDSLKALLKYIL